ncbi:MAG: hypothetical protein D6762_02930 [Candidatus Neomarinimicrobiota bacterium]|nr:MAG: hypothetical protein D6762_02930 [Candidatus Neomarinimicrobiota bacterium]
MKKPLLSWFLLLGLLHAQSAPSLSPIVAYWKTLDAQQKETFLFSYLTEVYETFTDLKGEFGYNDLTNWYYDHKARVCFAILNELDTTELSVFVQWVDEYYSHDENVGEPFEEALLFAYRFQQAPGDNLIEKYQNLQFEALPDEKSDGQ